MENKTNSKLGILSKPAIIVLAGLFLTGVVLGVFLAMADDTGSSFNVGIMFLFVVPIWIILLPKLIKEIQRK